MVMGEGVLVDLVDVRSESEIQNPSSSCWFPSRPSQGALAIKLQAQCTALGSREHSLLVDRQCNIREDRIPLSNAKQVARIPVSYAMP